MRYKSAVNLHVFYALLSVICLQSSGNLAAGDAKPNIIFFYIDDLGWKDLGCYGSDFYETPAIDDLAEAGIRFTSAYQAAPRCVPSRTSLFTGKYHERPGVSDSQGLVPGEYTFAEALRDAGYHTFFTGKWHLGKDSTRYPDRQGFDVNKGGCEWGAPSGSEEGGGRYFSPYDCPTLSDGPAGEYLTDRLTSETINFITDHQANQPDNPFLACVFHYAVHTPIEAPESYVNPFREKLEGMEYQLPRGEIEGPAKTKLRQDHPVYAGMIAAVDKSVGKIRKSLEDLGITDNTIIIFSTDHGGLSTTLKSSGREISTSNYPLRSGKGWVYEGGIRSPLIIYWPGVSNPGTIVHEPVVNMDIYPTLLAMAGLPLQEGQHLDGESFLPLLRAEDWKRKNPIMWYFPLAKTGTGNPNMAALRSGDHKLIHYMMQDRFELYDLERDLSESHNLVSEQPLLADQLKDLLYSIETKTEMPEIGGNRMRVEKDQILPEWPVSIPESDYPEMKLVEFRRMDWMNSFEFHLEILEENSNVHPVDLKYFFRPDENYGWHEITSIEGKHHRLLPGRLENRWNYSGFSGKTMDIRISAHINNELYPVKIGEEILTGIPVKQVDENIPVPGGRRLREIISDKYQDGSLMIGGTTGSWAFDEPNGMVMDREFSYVTPENDFKQARVRRDINEWDWSDADAWLQHIIDNQQVLRIHGPIGPQCSRWVKDDRRTPGELGDELSTFLTALCKRYNDVENIEYMDVVNETVTRSGDWMGPLPGDDSWENPWTIMGFETGIPSAYPNLDSVPLYISRAFEIANKYAPGLKLVLNQHGGMEEKMWDKIKELLLYLRNEKGYRIDALGWQAHIETGWELQDDNLSRLESLVDWCHSNDLEFHITEFDSWILDEDKHDFEEQANTYEAILQILVQKSIHHRIGWNTWHISDAKGFQIERKPALFDIGYNPKPAYYSVQSALEKGRSVTSAFQNSVSQEPGSEINPRVKIFPNPVKQSFRLDSQEEILGINIYDYSGRIVHTYRGINSRFCEITVNSLGEGVYFMEVSYNHGNNNSYLRMHKIN